MTQIAGLVFDKDGTLVDFSGTWDSFAGDLIAELTGDDALAAKRLADAMGYDLMAQTFLPHSPVIAGTNREAAQCLADGLGRSDEVEEIEHFLAERAHGAVMAPVVPLAPYCDALRARGLKLGVATNDGEAPARAHLAQMGALDGFDFVAGYDSGHGGKPGPGMLLAFCEAMQLSPARCAMIGDSPHDLIAGERAGFLRVGVLTGVYDHGDLAPHADVILPDIGHLPEWLDAR